MNHVTHPDLNIIDFIEMHAAKSPDKVAITFLEFVNDNRNELNITFKDIYDNARAIAVALKKRGLKQGDRIIIFTTQTYDNIYSILGSIFAGAVFCIIPAPTDENKKQRFKTVMESARPNFILCNSALAKILEDTFYSNSHSRTLTKWLAKHIKHFDILDVENTSKNPHQWIKPNITGDSLIYLQYSSGSTAEPKGVMITHNNLMENVLASEKALSGNGTVSNSLSWVPFFHNTGLDMIFLNLYMNSRLIIMSPLAFMERPSRWLQAISDYKCQETIAPNSAYEFCTKMLTDTDLESIDLSSLRYAINGGEPVNYITLTNFTDKFRKCGFQFSSFLPGYGLAESTCVVTLSTHGPKINHIDYTEMQKNNFVEVAEDCGSVKHIVSVGPPLKGVKLVTVNPYTGNLCGENEVGEIWIQGPSVSKGYWNLAKEFQKDFRGTCKGHEGFFLKTGDLGILKENQLYITGRFKELIIINGHNLYSNDIETALKDTIPCLNACSIVSFGTNIKGKERVVTCIEAPSKDNFDMNNLSEKVNSVIYSMFEFTPYDIVFVKEHSLPRTDNRKIKSIKVKTDYENGKLPVIFSSQTLQEDILNTKNIIAPKNEIEKKLMEIVTNIAEIDTEISIDDNFFSNSLDSLAIAELSATIEEEFKVTIPIKYFFEYPTIEGISNYINLSKNSNRPILIEQDKTYLLSECKLDEQINPYTYENTVPKNIFITGTTGFLGSHLIKALMTNTDAKIYCHVRAHSIEDGFNRVKDNLKFYKCWDDNFTNRIIPILGDLTKPLLGIDEKTFDYLSKTIDTIYNSGSVLNFIYPYKYLKKSNVDGTIECLRLAFTNKLKYFNHVSTYSVFDNPSHFKTVAYENDPLTSPLGFFLGYSESKWVAEKVIRIAESRGLKISIYRPGEITGSSITGIWKMSDLISRFIVSSVQLKAIPDSNVNLHITPVDYVAEAIVHISLQKDSIGKAFHVINKKVLTVKELAPIIKSYGYDIDIVPHEEWKNMLAASGPDNALKLLQPLFFEEKTEHETMLRRYSDMEATFDDSNTINGLKNSEIRCAPLNTELIHLYLDFFVDMGYLPKPKKI